MIKTIKHTIFILAALSTGCFFIAGCENDIKQVRALGQKTKDVEVITKVTSYLSQDAKMKAKLTAPLMTRYQGDSVLVEFPKTVHVDFYEDSLKVESFVFAKYGRYIENQRKVLLRDSVVVINLMKGDTLRTEELWWDQNRQLFYTDKPVHIRQPDQKMDGAYGMEADQNFRKWTLFSTSGVMNVADSTIPH
ncbi:MAG: LPS export ABC transporter periplasmic protein LptC [Filimonas sp.]|nr:LPS export ABC transporter periplasmic protein LptC [Filimonas sp.]